MLNNINKVLDEYKPDNSIWREYSDDVLMLKEAVNNLSDADRIIFVMYAEYGSLRKVGKQLGVSHSIIYKNIMRIKKQIYDFVRTNSDYDNSDLCNRLIEVCGITEEDDMEMAEGEE